MTASEQLRVLRRKQFDNKGCIELTYDEHKLCARLEYEIECEGYLDHPDTFIEHFPEKNESLDEYYMDHAIKSGIVTSFYTTYGIKGVESVFIRKMKDHDCDVDKLEQMIRRNPHLSNVIKTNLLQNLNNVRKMQLR